MKLGYLACRVFGLSALLTPFSLMFAAPGDVQLLLNGSPAAIGNYTFPFAADNGGLVLDNGLVRFTFDRDDAAGGVVTGWDGSTSDRPATTSISATSIIVNGVELAHNLNGVNPRDPDRQHSFYIDAGGGTSRLICTQVRVLRSSADLAEVSFVDSTSTPLQHEHHLIMRRGKPGLYGYDILTAAARTSISEVRMNARWDRSIFDHAFNWERGGGVQPTYAYLATQTSVGDETWRIDGINNPNLPSPESNSGNLPAGYVYTKYNWTLYHHENPMFGHYGHGFGAWLTPLGGVTDQTLAAFYGVGPNHQDLAIHQDALILNYFGANHYGLPSYALSAGYRRLYGPWFTFVNAGDANDPAAMISAAAQIAETEIAENRSGSDWIDDPLYPKVPDRSVVKGHLAIADGRPAASFWVVLSTQNVTDVYSIHEPTYFVKTDANGDFALPGIPPPLLPGTTTAGTYTLYIFAADGSVTDQYKQTGVTLNGATTDLGTITWAPTNYSTFLWQIGKADRMGGEFALATNPKTLANPRAYEKPSLIPGTLTWNVGSSWEPKDWYYDQANAGVWTIAFNLDRTYQGTAYFTVSTSMQSGGTPTIAVNGSNSGLTGSLPNNNDSTIARQADRSGYPRRAIISFPASRLVVGQNTITLTKATGGGAGSGLGWDTLLLEVDEPTPPPPAQLALRIKSITGPIQSPQWTLQVDNTGSGAANDARVDSFALTSASGPGTPTITGRDPSTFAVPMGNIASGQSAMSTLALDFSQVPTDARYSLQVGVSANGGRVRSSLSATNVASTAVSLTQSGYTLNRRTGRIVQPVTLTNSSNLTITGPVYLALDGLPAGVVLTSAMGVTTVQAPAGSPLVVASSGDMAPGASVNLVLEFTPPASGGIQYTPRILAGITAP